MQHKMPSITSDNSSNDGAKNNVLSIYQGHCLKAVPVGYETHVHSFVTNGPYAGQSRETLLEISPSISWWHVFGEVLLRSWRWCHPIEQLQEITKHPRWPMMTLTYNFFAGRFWKVIDVELKCFKPDDVFSKKLVGIFVGWFLLGL